MSRTALRIPVFAFVLLALIVAASAAANPEDALLEAVGMGDQESLRKGLRQAREAGEAAYATLKEKVAIITGAPAPAPAPAGRDEIDEADIMEDEGPGGEDL